MKQSLEACLNDYTTKELIEFHANLNALFCCCTEDFHLLPLLCRVLSAIQDRREPLTEEYMKRLNDLLPDDYKFKRN